MHKLAFSPKQLPFSFSQNAKNLGSVTFEDSNKDKHEELTFSLPPLLLPAQHPALLSYINFKSQWQILHCLDV